MSVIIKGGTVVNADQSFRADVYCEDGIIQAVGPDMDAPLGVDVVDAGGCYVMLARASFACNTACPSAICV